MEDDYKEALLVALTTLLQRDSYLIENRTWETSISAKLMAYLQPLFPDYDVDHEYDKHGDLAKIITADAEGAERPDILIHRRGSDEQNLFAIEIKSKERSIRDDLAKLEALTSPTNGYGYTYGIHIHFRHNPPRIHSIRLYSNGVINQEQQEELRAYLVNGNLPMTANAQ